MDSSEVLDGGILDKAELAFETGIVHRDAEAAESRDGFVDQGADVVFLLNVGANKLSLRAQRL
jgi:hypothetical protein